MRLQADRELLLEASKLNSRGLNRQCGRASVVSGMLQVVVVVHGAVGSGNMDPWKMFSFSSRWFPGLFAAHVDLLIHRRVLFFFATPSCFLMRLGHRLRTKGERPVMLRDDCCPSLFLVVFWPWKRVEDTNLDEHLEFSDVDQSVDIGPAIGSLRAFYVVRKSLLLFFSAKVYTILFAKALRKICGNNHTKENLSAKS